MIVLVKVQHVQPMQYIVLCGYSSIFFSYPYNNLYLYISISSRVLLPANLHTFSMWVYCFYVFGYHEEITTNTYNKKLRCFIACALVLIRLNGLDCNLAIFSLLNRGHEKLNTCLATLSVITSPPAHKWTSRICVFALAPLLPFDSVPGPGAAATAAVNSFQRPFRNSKGDTNLAANTSTVDRRAPRRRRALQVSLMSKH